MAEAKNNNYFSIKARHYWQKNEYFFRFNNETAINELGPSNTIMIVRNHDESINDQSRCPLVEYINVKTMDSWKQGSLSFYPQNKNAHIIGCTYGYMFTLGGINDKNKPTRSVYVLDFNTITLKSNKTWIKIKPMSESRIDFVACVGFQYSNYRFFPNKKINPEIMIFAIGGTDTKGKHLKTIEIMYTLDRERQRTITTRVARTHHSAIYHKGYLYVVGGKDHRDKVLGTVERYAITERIKENEVHIKLPLDLQLYDTCVAILSDKLYVIGGCDDKNIVSGKIHELDLEKQVWSSSTLSLTMARRKGSVAVIDNTLYVFGGYNQQNEPILETEKLSMNSNKKLCVSKPFHKLNFAYSGQNPIVYPEKLFSYEHVTRMEK